MFETGSILFLYAESPVHWGTGTSYGVVDLPIQRERHTGYPMAQAAGIKGSLRAHFSRKGGKHALSQEQVFAMFGPETTNASKHSGAVSFSDARLLLFPARSLKGTYVLTTSALALGRLTRDLELAGVEGPPELAGEPGPQEAWVTGRCDAGVDAGGKKIVLDESVLEAKSGVEGVDAIADWIAEHALPREPKFFAEKVRTSFAVLPQDVYRDLVTMGTIIEAHASIDDEKGTVRKGALFTEEVVPPEAVFYTVGLAARPSAEAKDGLEDAAAVVARLAELDGEVVQMGGDSTTGRGMMRIRVAVPAAARA